MKQLGCMQRTTILAICVRVLVALFTRTFFQPDEYLQSLEPAHVTVFGYGHLTWEWLTIRPIRSAVYPALNVPLFWILKVTGLDNTWPSLLVRVQGSIDARRAVKSVRLSSDCKSKNSAWYTCCCDGCMGLRAYYKSDW